MRLGLWCRLEFSSDSGAGGLMRIDEFSQQAGGVIEVREGVRELPALYSEPP